MGGLYVRVMGGVMYVCVVVWFLCVDGRSRYLYSVYCTRRIPAHLRCTQCSIMLDHIDIGFLTYICLWQISQVQTCLRVVVGPGLVSTLPEKQCQPSSGSARPFHSILRSAICLSLGS